MYCRQHGYPTAPLISYKIAPPGDQWGFSVPVREVSQTPLRFVPFGGIVISSSKNTNGFRYFCQRSFR